MNVRVLACQQPLHERLSNQTLEQIAEMDPDFVCLPEHYPLPNEVNNLRQAAGLFEERKAYLTAVSSEMRAALIGGTLTEETDNGYFNTCYVFENGKEVGFYRKVHPTRGELDRGVLQGTEFKMFELRGIRIGVLICADVLNARSFEELASLKCQITFVPTASPFRPEETMEAKYERDQSIFLEGARKIGCPIVKTCGVGTTFGHPIQGRSLIVTPEKIVARAEPHQEHLQVLLFAELNV
jgi:predicted amidohydrolase